MFPFFLYRGLWIKTPHFGESRPPLFFLRKSPTNKSRSRERNIENCEGISYSSGACEKYWSKLTPKSFWNTENPWTGKAWTRKGYTQRREIHFGPKGSVRIGHHHHSAPSTTDSVRQPPFAIHTRSVWVLGIIPGQWRVNKVWCLPALLNAWATVCPTSQHGLKAVQALWEILFPPAAYSGGRKKEGEGGRMDSQKPRSPKLKLKVRLNSSTQS